MDDPKREPLVPAVLAGVLAFAAAVGFVGFAIGHYTNHATKTAAAAAAPVVLAPVAPSVAAGAHVFVQFACVQCHGERGQGGASPDVPALSTIKTTLTETQLTTIIDHGLG